MAPDGLRRSPKDDSCPSAICGVWVQRMAQCESLCPLLEGLGLPKALLYAACPIVDRIQTTVRISCGPDVGQIEIVDKSKLFGRNATRAALDGTEQEVLTRGRKKPFMLSADASEWDGRGVTLTCRLISRGDGWMTRQERFLSESETDAAGRPLLVERHVLVAPGREDVQVVRMFERGSDEDLSAPSKKSNHIATTAADGAQADATKMTAAGAHAAAAAENSKAANATFAQVHPLIGELLTR